MKRQETMLQILQQVAKNSIREELREHADGQLSLAMLAAKLVDRSHAVTYSNQWKVDQNGNVTVTLTRRDAKRYSMSSCSVTREQFEHAVLAAFSSKISARPLTEADWAAFASRLEGRKLGASPTRHTPDVARRSSVGSSVNFF